MNFKETYHPALERFIEDLDSIVQAGGGEEKVTEAVARRLKELLKYPDILPHKLKQPNSEHYVMYPVYIAPDESFSIASAVWGLNQSTPPHDHGTWGVIGIVEGTEHEIRYVPSQNKSTSILKEGESLHQEGEVTICCTSDQDLHEVSCASDIPCVGLHIYGGNIGKIERQAYNKDTGEIKKFTSEWAVP